MMDSFVFYNCGLPEAVNECRFYLNLQNRLHFFDGSFRGGWDIVNKKEALTDEPVPLQTLFILQRFIEVLKCLRIQTDRPDWCFVTSTAVG